MSKQVMGHSKESQVCSLLSWEPITRVEICSMTSEGIINITLDIFKMRKRSL